ncbi:hypothetical protein ACFV9E_08855 [Streptomyces sp. NPDC059835]|uniref:hypothetical protein n=1 Tax=Streptomyces sp. NPDC059835 TaxID=3346967 RepID=UPI0036570AE3
MRDLLRGRQLGHPVHPVLVQVPIGCRLSASVLDLVPGTRHAMAVVALSGALGGHVAYRQAVGAQAAT